MASRPKQALTGTRSGREPDARPAAPHGAATVADATYEALIIDWDGDAVSDGQGGATALGSRIERMCALGVHVFVVSGADVGSVDGRLGARPGGPGRLFLCINGGSEVFEVAVDGPTRVWRRPARAGEPGDPSDSARWAADWLARRGITGSLVLIAGDDFGPVGGPPGRSSLLLVPELSRAGVVSLGAGPGGVPHQVTWNGPGPARLASLLDYQLGRRTDRRAPWFDHDPRWVLEVSSGTVSGRAAEALGTVGNGFAATRGHREEERHPAGPPFAVNNVYSGGDTSGMVAGPDWTSLRLRAGPDERFVDLRTGVLARRAGAFRSVRFVSAADPYALALRAEGPPERLGPGQAPGAPDQTTPVESRVSGSTRTLRTWEPGGGSIAVAARDRVGTAAHLRTVERLAAWAAVASGRARWRDAERRLADLERTGFDRALAAHREAWARRWEAAEVTIEGSPADELAARFAVFHLLCAGPDQGEAAVGARGLTGPAYGGHVFWDADIFVLPALAALAPGVARSMLEYRVRRLPAARAAAAAERRAGARYPWESARDGLDVTPRLAIGGGGQKVPIRTGRSEEHITADVAWAASEYAAWTGDTGFLAGPGLDLLLETARYWASRVRRSPDGRAHLYGVMGPDEYHDVVDDNAFTNIMARWNLRAAASAADRAGGAGRDERRAWRGLARDLVDGYDPDSGRHEQFAGYWDLDPMLISHVGTPPLTADILLGPGVVARSQLIKQADVLMAHHLVPGEMQKGSLSGDLAFYGPRTAHGSSLSPAIHASLLARDGQPDAALGLFRMAARLDLDDLTRTTSGGLHLATFGGLWQALAYGFAGLRPRAGGLEVDPCLPHAWDSLGLRFRLGGSPVSLRCDHSTVRVDCSAPLSLWVGGAPAGRCDPPGRSYSLAGGHRDRRRG